MKIVENRKKFFAASLIVIIIGFAAMIFNAQAGRGAFQYDVEFTGGTSFDLDLGQEYKQEDLQKIITDVTGQDSPQIQQVIGTNEVTVKIQSIDSATRETLTNAILEAYPNAVMGEVNDVSGTVSHEMQTAAIKATLIAAVAMLLYISLRFHDFPRRRQCYHCAASRRTHRSDSLCGVPYPGQQHIHCRSVDHSGVLHQRDHRYF